MTYTTKLTQFALLLATLALGGCLGMPDAVKPVSHFEVNRYLGKWYEIARLDHSFERGLENITANYTLREDGGIDVINRGFSLEEQKWETAEGKAYFVDKKDEGYLKVSFFGPFYGSYVIFELEQENYEYAFVSGPDLSYLWLLARTPNVSQQVIDRFKNLSREAGFEVQELIFVTHDKNIDKTK
ncbi:MAG: lipocalin family protein [Oleiphilus sp.]